MVQKTTFIQKLFKILEEESYSSYICWSQSGTSFLVLNTTEFSKNVLPKVFKHNNYTSFVRQLNLYGFHKLNRSYHRYNATNGDGDGESERDTAPREFYHPKFILHRPELLGEIRRKLPATNQYPPPLPLESGNPDQNRARDVRTDSFSDDNGNQSTFPVSPSSRSPLPNLMEVSRSNPMESQKDNMTLGIPQISVHSTNSSPNHQPMRQNSGYLHPNSPMNPPEMFLASPRHNNDSRHSSPMPYMSDQRQIMNPPVSPQYQHSLPPNSPGYFPHSPGPELRHNDSNYRGTYLSPHYNSSGPVSCQQYQQSTTRAIEQLQSTVNSLLRDFNDLSHKVVVQQHTIDELRSALNSHGRYLDDFNRDQYGDSLSYSQYPSSTRHFSSPSRIPPQSNYHLQVPPQQTQRPPKINPSARGFEGGWLSPLSNVSSSLEHPPEKFGGLNSRNADYLSDQSPTNYDSDHYTNNRFAGSAINIKTPIRRSFEFEDVYTPTENSPTQARSPYLDESYLPIDNEHKKRRHSMIDNGGVSTSKVMDMVNPESIPIISIAPPPVSPELNTDAKPNIAINNLNGNPNAPENTRALDTREDKPAYVPQHPYEAESAASTAVPKVVISHVEEDKRSHQQL
ncbi:kinase-regulated stress-responsive transcription factor skn7 [Nowakowskiella sp. JEL0407]|nr:kinase-regulated stress-responsive transcription factor skn7 [Nowakowskiella sp. JEL0407]